MNPYYIVAFFYTIILFIVARIAAHYRLSMKNLESEVKFYKTMNETWKSHNEEQAEQIEFWEELVGNLTNDFNFISMDTGDEARWQQQLRERHE